MNIALAIQHIYPHADSLIDFKVQDDGDGKGQYIAEWNMAEPKPDGNQLKTAWIDYLKQSKKQELSIACQNEILKGFTSANGHSYQFDFKDQDNLTQQMLFLVQDPTIEEISWKTLNEGVVVHTREEFLQVCKDADIHKRSNFGKYWSLEVQLNSATTEEEIVRIIW
jgi:hypothetical protein